MNRSLFHSLVLTFGLALALSPAARAQDANPPYVATPLPNLTIAAGTASTKVKLKKTFALTGVSQQVVRFATTLGNIDVELRPDAAPLTVANFLNYVNRGAYNGSFFHRSVANFVVQGGGFTFANDTVTTIPTDAPVKNEFKLSNLRGTIAMAKTADGPDTATDQWFFNESDENASNLDNQNGGFTVFGQIITNGLTTLDALAAVPIVNAGSQYDSLPVRNYTTGTITADNLLFVNSIASIPTVPASEGAPALLNLSVTSSNPGLVTPTLLGSKLKLAFTPGATGVAQIKIKAKNAAKSKVKASFQVTVQ